MENMKTSELRRQSMRYYGQKIESLQNSLTNINASSSDAFISGGDRAKLLLIDKLRNDLQKDIDFINKTNQTSN